MYATDSPKLPTGPMHMLFDAAVGLFDVSGFSKIADRLEKEEAEAGSPVRIFDFDYVVLLRRGTHPASLTCGASCTVSRQ